MMLSIVTTLRARCIIVAALALPVIFLQGCGGSSSNEPKARGEECTPDNALATFKSVFLWDRDDENCLCDTEWANFIKAGDPPTTTFDYSVLDAVKLHDWPMIHSHDSGTGYHDGDICFVASTTSPAVPHNWAVTQKGDLVGQLNCGARAFDIRIQRKEQASETLIFVHGTLIYPQKTFAAALEDVKTWAIENPEELVILFVKPKNALLDAAIDAGPSAGTPTNIAIGGVSLPSTDIMKNQVDAAGIVKNFDCAAQSKWTLGEARTKALLKNASGDAVGPGRVLVSQHSCGNNGPNGNYDTRLICHKQEIPGQAPTTMENAWSMVPLKQMGALTNVDSCYDDNMAELRTAYWGYIKDVTDGDKATRTAEGEGTRTPERMWMVQAHWQYTPISVLAGARDLGTQGGGCILNDVKATCINLGLAANIRNGFYQHGLNLIDIDYVCHHGPDLFKAIKEYVASDYFKQFIPTPAPTPAPR